MKYYKKRYMSAVLIVCILVISMSSLSAEESSVYKTVEIVSYSGGTKTITVVWADLDDKQIRIDTGLAQGGVGETATLMNIYDGTLDSDGKPLAAINGTFFNANYDMQPLGNLIIDGNMIHGSTTGTTMAVLDGNEIRFDPLFSKFSGSINGQWEWPYNWYAWNINHVYNDPSAVMIFDPFFNGSMQEHEYTVIEVDKRMVTKISVGTFNIPEEGYLILTKDQSIIDKFSIGDQVDYKLNAYAIDYESQTASDTSLSYESVRTAVGAGPLLIQNGVNVVNPEKEGFTDEKLTVKKAARSMIGVTADNRLCMAVVPSVTLAELAEIALELGLYNAMNLDGGGSSGLVYKDDYLFTPGREISNGIVIRHLNQSPIGIQLNGNHVYFDTEPYINAEFGRTLVPLRGICEALGATVGWDGETSSITITRYNTQLKLQVNSKDIYVNNVKKSMDVPVVIRDDRSYVPVRFVTEYLGGDVDWNAETRTVILEVDNIGELLEQANNYISNHNYEQGIDMYESILVIDELNLEAIKALAHTYNTVLKDYELAIKYYKQAINLDDDDYGSVNSLAWVLYAKGEYYSAIDYFELLEELTTNNANAYYGIGLCYSAYAVQNVSLAIVNFEKAIDLGLSGDAYIYAKKYIDEH